MSHSLLIVEDDNLIRRGLEKSIRDLRLPIGEIRSASDGREALAMCRTRLPDIAITDIRMPGMNGLSFIQNARRLEGSCQYIILSGYDDFSYAKKAIRLGVIDYLLKPVNLETLRAILTCAIDRQEVDEAARAQERLESRVLRSTLDSVLAAILRGVLDRTHTPEESGQLLGTFPSEAADPLLLLVICRYGPDMDRRQRSVADAAVCRFLADPLTVRFTYRNRFAEVAYLLEVDSGLLAELGEFRSRFERFVNDPENDFFDGMQVGASSCQPSLRSVPLLAEEAFDALDRRLLEPGRRFFGFQIVPADGRSLTPPLRIREDLAKAVQLGRRDAIDQGLRGLFETWRGMSNADPRRLKDHLHALLFSVFKNLVDDPRECCSRQEIEALFRSSDSLEMLRGNLCSRILSVRSAAHGTEDDSLDAIARAARYIDQNSDRDLDLETVARAVRISPNYLSSRFREKTGERFVKYLQRVRIDKAKRFLADGRKKIADIAAAVGFSEDKYFHKVFKEITGMTATQFRASIGANRVTASGGPARVPRSR